MIINKIKEIIVEPNTIYENQRFKIKIKCVMTLKIKELKPYKVNEMRKFTIKELRGD